MVPPYPPNDSKIGGIVCAKCVLVLNLDIRKSRRRIGLLGARNTAAILGRSYSCSGAAENTGSQSIVRHIPAQIGGPSQTGLKGSLFRRSHSLASTTIILTRCHWLCLCCTTLPNSALLNCTRRNEKKEEKEALQNSQYSFNSYKYFRVFIYI